MSDSFVEVPPDSTGKKIDGEDVTVGLNDVHRQRVILAAGQSPQGYNVYHVVAAASTNAANIKAGPGQVYGWRIFNAAGYPIFVKLHNTAGTPTPGTGVVETIGVQAGLPNSDSSLIGDAFSVGIGISIVKGIADSDATAVALSDCVVDLFWA